MSCLANLNRKIFPAVFFLQDLAPVTSLVHRRCGDPKAAVRRGALQLLEALLVMRASWQGYVRQLPGSADLALLEAATADPLVRAIFVVGGGVAA
jgi:hypothetical protein